MFRKKKKQRSDPEEVAIAAALQAVNTGHLPYRQGSQESAVQTSHRGLQAASNHTQESANMVHQSLPDSHMVMDSQHITDPALGLPEEWGTIVSLLEMQYSIQHFTKQTRSLSVQGSIQPKQLAPQIAAIFDLPPLDQKGQLVSVDLSVDFSVRYVGMIYNAQGLQHFQEDEVDLINALDQAQMENQFKHADTQRDLVYLNLSKHGVKVIEPYAQPPKIVRWRYGMIEVVRLVHFEDSTGSQLLALKICKEGDDVYDCLLFHCEDQAQARQICQLLGVLFDAVCQDPSLQP